MSRRGMKSRGNYPLLRSNPQKAADQAHYPDYHRIDEFLDGKIACRVAEIAVVIVVRIHAQARVVEIAGLAHR
jgi:hypothetical protein